MDRMPSYTRIECQLEVIHGYIDVNDTIFIDSFSTMQTTIQSNNISQNANCIHLEMFGILSLMRNATVGEYETQYACETYCTFMAWY